MRRFSLLFIVRVLALATAASMPALSLETASDFYEDAQRLQDNGEDKAALIQLKNALSQDDQHVPALLLSGDIYLKSGQAPAAEDAYGEALLLGADASYTTPRIAEAYLLQNKYRKILNELPSDLLSGNGKAELLGYRALAQLGLNNQLVSEESINQALTINSKSRVANIALAQILLGDNQAEEAKIITTLLVSLYPGDPRSWNIHAATLNALGNKQEAIAAYSRAVDESPNLVGARLARAALLAARGELEQASADVDFVLKNHPGDPRGAYMKGQLLEQQGDETASLEQYRRCAEILSLAPADYLAENVQLTIMASVSHLKTGETQQARSYLEAFHNQNKNNSQSGQLLAEILLKDGDPSGALKVLNALSKTPESEKLRGRALGNLGRHEQAIRVWQSLANTDHRDIDVDAELSLNQILAGNTEIGITGLENVIARDNTRVTETALLAQTYSERGEYSRTIELAEHLILLEPDNPRFHNLLGRSHMYAGDLERAHEVLEAGAAGEPDYLSIQVSLAEVETAQRNLSQARKRLLHLSETYPASSQVMLQRARVERLEGNLPEARKWAENAMLSNSSWLDPRKFLIYLLVEMEAIAEAEELARETSARNPDNMEIRFQLAGILQAQRKSTEARSTYQVMVRRALQDHELLYRIAQQQIKLGALTDASASLYRAMSIQPDSMKYRVAYIRVEIGLENHETALRLAKELGQDFPESTTPYTLSAAAYSGLGQGTQAAQQYTDALRLEPDNRQLLMGHYRTLMALGKMQEAESLLETWLKQSPNDLQAKSAYSDLMIKSRRWPKAEIILKEMLETQPDSPGILNNLAYVLQEMGRPEAVDVAYQAQRISPQLAQVNDTLGWILVQNEKAAEGLPYLREAVSRQSDNPTLHYHLAVALRQLDRQSEAAQELRLALSQPGEFDERQAAMALLKELK